MPRAVVMDKARDQGLGQEGLDNVDMSGPDHRVSRPYFLARRGDWVFLKTRLT